MHWFTIITSLWWMKMVYSELDTSPQADIKFWDAIGRKNLERKYKFYKDFKSRKLPKNVILIIGDGMGIPAISAGRIYKNQKMLPGLRQLGNAEGLLVKGQGRQCSFTEIRVVQANEKYHHKPFFFETLDTTGILMTHSYDYIVTDSAAGAMALMGGQKQDMLGMLPGSDKDCVGEHAAMTQTIADLGIKSGRNVGFATTTTLTHATPAALFAKAVHRFHEKPKANGSSQCVDIAAQLLTKPANKFKVLLAGGHSNLKGSIREDKVDIVDEWKKLGGRREVVYNRDELLNVKPENTDNLMGVFSEKFMEYEIFRKDNASQQPSLLDMGTKAVEMMEHNNKNGYFLLLEGAKIDIAEHVNVMHATFTEIMMLDETVKKVRAMTNKNETLVIVTADHSHALAIAGYTLKTQSIMDGGLLEEEQGLSEIKLVNVKVPVLNFVSGPGYEKKRTNKTKAEYENPNYKSPAMVYSKYGAHGGEDVPIFSDGPMAWLFTGLMENTEVAYTIKHLMCLEGADWSACDKAGALIQGDVKYSYWPTTYIPLDTWKKQPVMLLATLLTTVVAMVAIVVAVVLAVMVVKKQEEEVMMEDSTMTEPSAQSSQRSN